MHFKRQFIHDIDPVLREILSDNLDDLINTGQQLKHDKTTTVAKLDVAGKALVIKRYNARSFWHRLKRALRQSRAQRCWLMSQVFADAGLHVAPRVAMVEKRWLFFRLDAYFVAEWVEGNELLTWLPEQASAKKQRVKQQLDQVFAILAQHRLSHGDMKATNLLWRDQCIVFLDLDAAKQHWNRLMWLRDSYRDKKRFAKNGADFVELLVKLRS